MIAATVPRDDPRTTRLVHVDPARRTVVDRSIGGLRALLHRGDLLVVNDAATLPASLRGHAADGRPVELRLAGEMDDGTWRAIVFGAGDWRTPTEARPDPPRLDVGARVAFDGLSAVVFEVDRASPRLVRVAFDAAGPELWRSIYRAGRPVQYAYLERPLALWDVQTRYAGRPWAVEPPSAGFALTWELLLDLRRSGVRTVPVTHAAGLSSTGDAALDARLPLPERYEVPPATVAAIAETRAGGGRVIALGTSATRALEGSAALHGGTLVAGRGTTELRLGPRTRRAVVDGIVTGVHDVATSHFALLESFAPRDLLERGVALAEARGYRGHEFGDAFSVIAEPRSAS
jgi:S-adenosylmethionine:tRNA ribosyltransferase-isomerase